MISYDIICNCGYEHRLFRAADEYDNSKSDTFSFAPASVTNFLSSVSASIPIRPEPKRGST